MNRVTRWWWLRHGPVSGAGGRFIGRTDLPIDFAAIAAGQLERIAARLPADAVWIASPAARARATLEALKKEVGVSRSEIILEPGFAEQDFGDWDGRGHAEIAAEAGPALDRFWALPADAAPPAGESFAALLARVGTVVREVNQAHGGHDIVAIAHGGSIRAALALALGLSPAGALAFVIDTLSLTRIDHVAGQQGEHGTPPHLVALDGWRVVGVNQVIG